MAVALRHLAFGGRRKAHAEVAEALQLRVAQGMAVNDVDVRAEQAFGLEPVPAFGRSRRAAALVHRSDLAELACHSKVVQGDVERRVVRPEHGSADVEQGIAVMTFEQPFELGARIPYFPERPFSGL